MRLIRGDTLLLFDSTAIALALALQFNTIAGARRIFAKLFQLFSTQTFYWPNVCFSVCDMLWHNAAGSKIKRFLKVHMLFSFFLDTFLLYLS